MRPQEIHFDAEKKIRSIEMYYSTKSDVTSTTERNVVKTNAVIAIDSNSLIVSIWLSCSIFIMIVSVMLLGASK